MNARKTITSLLAMALVTAGLAAAPTTASAAETCVLGPATVANAAKPLGITYSVTRTVAVRVTNCTPAAAKATKVSWWMTMTWEDGPSQITALKPTYLGKNTYSYKGSFTDHPHDASNFLAGSYPTFVQTVRGTTKVKRSAPTIKLLRASRGDLGVWWRGSTKPPKGYWLYVNADLYRANWDSGKYNYYDNQPVYMQFKPKGGSYRWITVNESKDSTGQSGGVFWVKATVDGCYRFVYKGNSTTGPSTSNADCVDVK